MNRELPGLLAARLAGPLPEAAANERFEPRLGLWRHDGPPPADARSAAVLVLLYPHEDRWHVPLTLRPPHRIWGATCRILRELVTVVEELRIADV
jgi:hypothetical protein